MLLENPVATIKTCDTLIQATLLLRETGVLKYDFLGTIGTSITDVLT